MRAHPINFRPLVFSLFALCCTALLWGCNTPDPSPRSSASPQTLVTASPAASTSETPTLAASKSLEQEPEESSATSQNTAAQKDTEANGRQVVEPQTVVENTEKGGEFLQKANMERGSDNYAAAAKLYNEALMADPKNYNIPYEGGCNFALWGKNDLALETLHVAADLGYPNSDALDSNVALDTLRDNPRFAKLKAKVEANKAR